MKKIILCVITLVLSSNAFSSGSYSGTVSNVRIDRSGLGMVAFSGPVTGAPAPCRSSSYASYMSFDTNTEGGKAIYAMALAAASTGKAVTAYGNGACSDYSNIVESLGYWHYVR